jgi:hypothetical protein
MTFSLSSPPVQSADFSFPSHLGAVPGGPLPCREPPHSSSLPTVQEVPIQTLLTSIPSDSVLTDDVSSFLSAFKFDLTNLMLLSESNLQKLVKHHEIS